MSEQNAKAGEFDKFKHGYAGTIYRGQGRTLDEVYVGHSSHWRSSAAYVALTRHREAVHIFAARETVKDLDTMAAGMARGDNKRAASAYTIDEVSAVRADCTGCYGYFRPIAPRGCATITATVAPATTKGQDKGQGIAARVSDLGQATTGGSRSREGARRSWPFGGQGR